MIICNEQELASIRSHSAQTDYLLRQSQEKSIQLENAWVTLKEDYDNLRKDYDKQKEMLETTKEWNERISQVLNFESFCWRRE